MNKLYSVFSGKGGVGKTNFLLNLAGTLSNLNKKVLILDLDLYGGGIGVYLNKSSRKNICDLYKDKDKTNLNINDYVTRYNKYIDFIASPTDFKSSSKTNEEILDLIQKSKLNYDYILIDLSHNLSQFNQEILKKVNKVFYIFTNDTLDLKNTYLNLKFFKKHNIKYNTILNYSIHFNKKYYVNYDIKSIIKSNIDYEISSEFHEPLIENIIARGQIQTMINKRRKDYNIFYLIARKLGD